MDNKLIIREFRSYVDGFVECCTSDHETHELLKAVDKLIEEQEERIAIMSEGGWHKITESAKSLPKKSGEYIVAVEMAIIGNGGKEKRKMVSEKMDYDVDSREFTLTGSTFHPKHWMNMPKLPKEGDE